MRGFVQDVHYAVRQLRKSPGLTATAVISLALGIGANTAIFSVLNALLLRPLPYKSSSKLVWLSTYLPRLKDHVVGTPDYLQWRRESRSLADIAAYDEGDANLTGGANPERIHYRGVSASLFSVLGIQPVMGRNFRDDENAPDAPPVVILCNGFWQRRFGGLRSVIGTKIRLDGIPHEVVGIMPASFVFPDRGLAPDLLLPLSLPENVNYATSRQVEMVQVIAKLRSKVSIDQAKTELSGVEQRFTNTFPPAFRNLTAGMETEVVPLRRQLVGDVRHTLIILLAAVVFLLLVACANVANLQLAKATTQEKELGLRSALGASRSRLLRQIFVENLLLCSIGALAGGLLALGTRAFVHPAGTALLSHFNPIELDYRVLTFTAATALLAGVLTGLAPAALTFRPHLNEAIKEGAHTLTDNPSLRRVRKLLVIGQFAVTMVLLVASGLFIRTFTALLQVNPGFDPHNVLTLNVSLPDASYGSATQQQAFFDNLIQRLDGTAGITSAAAISQLPLTPYESSGSVVFENRPAPPPGMRPNVPISAANPKYFSTMHVPILRGRNFDASDNSRSLPVILVSQEFARHYFGDEDPLGKRVQLEGKQEWRTIIGVVGDTHHLGLQLPPSAEVFTDFEQNPRGQMSIVLRSVQNPLDLIPIIRQHMLDLDREQPIFDVATMDRRLSDSISTQRLNMFLITSFGVVSTTLALVGIYGVLSFYVVRRTQEFGIRVALGAERNDIFQLTLKPGALMSLTGATVGLPTALVLSRFMSSMIFGIKVNDPVTFAGAAVVLVLAGVAGSYIPARRAASLDPMVALRYE